MPASALAIVAGQLCRRKVCLPLLSFVDLAMSASVAGG